MLYSAEQYSPYFTGYRRDASATTPTVRSYGAVRAGVFSSRYWYRRSASQAIFLMKPQSFFFFFFFCKIPAPESVLTQLNLVHVLKSDFFKIIFCIIIPTVPVF